MLILPGTRFKVDECLKSAARIGGCFLIFLFFSMLLFYFLHAWGAGLSQEVAFAKASRNGSACYPYEAIGSGGLTINRRHALGWVSRIADDLSLLAYNSRPDVSSSDSQLLVRWKTSKEQMTALSGKPLYLEEMEKGKGLFVSTKESNLWIKPILLENGTVLVEACRTLIGEDGGKALEKGQFFLTPQGGVPSGSNSSQEGFMSDLRAAQLHPSDLLIQKYGGNEYADWWNKAALEFTTGSRTYACFVSPGDCLIYEEGEWRTSAIENLEAGRPVALVRSITGRVAHVEAWDATGFCPVQLKLAEADRDTHYQIKPEVLPSKVRLRSATQVSCSLGKRRVILRQGDWLLKTATGWRNLRKLDELEQLLYFRIKGELLIFDRIEREQGRLVMKGHCFNGSRTQVQPFSIPVESDKSPGKSKRKRKAA